MKLEVCKQCGANEFLEVPGYRICKFCKSRFVLIKEEQMPVNTDINLRSDVDALLEKCKKDPSNARKYANLVLDIDPNNNEAKKFI